MSKTTILPDDATQALAKFDELLSESKILFVVLGDNSAASQLQQMADNLAGAPGEPRWVVWAKNPAHISDSVVDLDCSAGSRPDLAADRAFTTSLADKISDVILGNEPEPDNVRVFEAYANAEGGA